jgi:hypothetical protein
MRSVGFYVKKLTGLLEIILSFYTIKITRFISY